MGREEEWDALAGLIVTATGWTWQYIEEVFTVPQMLALTQSWTHIAPPAIALRRIAVALGIEEPDAAQAKPAHELIGSAALPVSAGRPNDPMLDLVGW
jgi:hypothetical protein